MKTNITETIHNIYTEDRELISSDVFESYIIYPEEGYMIRDKRTGETVINYVVIGSMDSRKNYEEIEIPEDKKSIKR